MKKQFVAKQYRRISSSKRVNRGYGKIYLHLECGHFVRGSEVDIKNGFSFCVDCTNKQTRRSE